MYKLKGVSILPSRIYRNRFECHFWGRNGQLIKQWILDNFGHDDMVYASGDIDSSLDENCGSLINREQLTMLLLKWA